MRLMLIVVCGSACAARPISTASIHPDNLYCQTHFDIHNQEEQAGCLSDLEEVRTQEYLSIIRKMEER